MPHIHLYSPQKVEYAMNLDGTRHDKNRAKEINPGTKAHKVLQHLKYKGIWPPKNSSGGDNDNTPSQPSSKNKSKTRSTHMDMPRTHNPCPTPMYRFLTEAPQESAYHPSSKPLHRDEAEI